MKPTVKNIITHLLVGMVVTVTTATLATIVLNLDSVLAPANTLVYYPTDRNTAIYAFRCAAWGSRRTCFIYEIPLDEPISSQYETVTQIRRPGGAPEILTAGSGLWILEERGWPLKCFTVLYQFKSSFVAPNAITLPWLGRRNLPLHPIWANLILNTLILSVASFLTSTACKSSRAAIRTYRGRCIKCGYDLQNLNEPGCPECGWYRQSTSS